MTKEAHNILAMKNGELMHIRHVDNGYSCGCTCFTCGQRLSAHNRGNEKLKAYHFQHVSGESCTSRLGGSTGGGVETIIHWGLKTAIFEQSKVFVPDLSEESRYLLQIPAPVDFGFIKLTRAKLEKSVKHDVGLRIPDVVGYLGNLRVSIEVTNTHSTSLEKKQDLEASLVDTLELHLKPLNHHLEKAIKLIRDKEWEELLKLVFPKFCNIELPLRWAKLIELQENIRASQDKEHCLESENSRLRGELCQLSSDLNNVREKNQELSSRNRSPRPY